MDDLGRPPGGGAVLEAREGGPDPGGVSPALGGTRLDRGRGESPGGGAL
jgi:hypothetical protein